MDPDKRPDAKPGADAEADAEPRLPQSAATERRPLIDRLLAWRPGPVAATAPAESGRPALGPAFRHLPPAELSMVSNILRLSDLRVEDVMTPRADIAAVEAGAALDEVIATFERGSFSRLPVYRETLDDPIGFVHLKDLALNYGFGNVRDDAEFKLSAHIRPALFVPPSMRIAALLQKMQGERVHMALVIDEFGGVDGLITIEDLVEQIVGDIEDEHDREDAEEWTREGDGVWLVQARADIREFEASEHVSLVPEDWEEDVGTMGGLVFTLANRIPARGEVILHPDGYEFEVVDADARRIKRLRLRYGNGSVGARQAAE